MCTRVLFNRMDIIHENYIIKDWKLSQVHESVIGYNNGLYILA